MILAIPELRRELHFFFDPNEGSYSNLTYNFNMYKQGHKILNVANPWRITYFYTVCMTFYVWT